MSAYDGRVVTATGAPAYTARPGFQRPPDPRPPSPPSCSCADSRHHVPGLGCGLPLNTGVATRDGRYCHACALLRTIPLYYETHRPPPPALITHSARTLLDQLTAAGRPISDRLRALATEETPPTMTPDTRAAIADATATPADRPTLTATTLLTGLHSGIHVTPETVAATAPDETDTPPADDQHRTGCPADHPGPCHLRRPEADNVRPANTREPVEEPLPVLLDRLARATATASAVKAIVDELRPEVERRVIARHAEEGTDRYRRDAALITLRFDADRVVVEDEPALRAILPDRDLDTVTVVLDPFADARALANAALALGNLLAMGTLDDLDTAALTPLADALHVTRALDPACALAAVEEELGAEVTRSGLVVADTGEPVAAIRVERGRPSGVQVRADAEVKAAALADVRAFLA